MWPNVAEHFLGLLSFLGILIPSIRETHPAPWIILVLQFRYRILPVLPFCGACWLTSPCHLEVPGSCNFGIILDRIHREVGTGRSWPEQPQMRLNSSSFFWQLESSARQADSYAWDDLLHNWNCKIEGFLIAFKPRRYRSTEILQIIGTTTIN